VAPPRAYHLAAEAALWPAAHWTVEASAYYKAQPRLLALDFPALSADSAAAPAPGDEQAQADFIGAVRGRAYGGTARVRWHDARFSAGAAYAVSHAERAVPSRFDGRMVPVPGNAPHALALDVAVRLGGGLRAGAGWHGAWGRRWALRQAYYDYVAVAEGPDALAPFDLDRPEDHALPPAHSLDLDLTLTRLVSPGPSSRSEHSWPT
jgi:hypothetical protein